MRTLLLALLTCVLSLTSVVAEPRTACTLIRTVDGDTIKVRIGKIEERVRMIGVDTPEKEPNEKARRDAQRTHQDLKTITTQGKASWEHLNSLLRPGQALLLEFDAGHTDRHGRLLAYVYTGSGTMLNEQMLRDGYASLMTVPPNVRYAKRLAAAYASARAEKRGLWQH
ncbi:MAG: thermonuclease family protein [Deltaproteobacteria bacterium]|nr:thermonuclease family protein [Deltaproteobacteria bacterium]